MGIQGTVRQRHRMLLLPLLLVGVGCNSIKKERESDFLKPFASAEPADVKQSRQSMPSERLLCIETAKTVAEKGHAEEAIQLYERAEELDPSAGSLDANLAPLYAEIGNYDAAIERYKRCVQRSPDDAGLINNYAWTLMEAGRFDRAIAEAKEGLKKSPSDSRLRSTLAMTFYRQGDQANAFQQWELAVGKTAAYHNLALLDIDAGNVASAREHLLQAKQAPESDGRSDAMLAALETSMQTR